MTLIEDDTMLSPPSRTNDDCGNDDGSSITVGKGTDNVVHHNDTADSQEDHQQHRHLVASSKAENGSELRNSVIGQSVDQVKRAINQTTDTTTTTTTSSSFSLIANVGQLALQPLLPHTDGVDSMITQQHQQRPPFNNDSDNNVMPSIQLHQQQDELALLPPHVHVHGSAFYQGLSCLCTMEDLIRDGCDANFVEYQSYPSLKWQPALFEQSIIQQLLETQFERYIHRVKNTDCQAELRRLLTSGPPIYISDPHGLPMADLDNDTHVSKLWFASDDKEHSSKLGGAVEGEERIALLRCLQEFVIVDGKEEGDDDDDHKDNDDNDSSQ